jgi:hypothetical protein
MMYYLVQRCTKQYITLTTCKEAFWQRVGLCPQGSAAVVGTADATRRQRRAAAAAVDGSS